MNIFLKKHLENTSMEMQWKALLENTSSIRYLIIDALKNEYELTTGEACELLDAFEFPGKYRPKANEDDGYAYGCPFITKR